MGLRLGGFVGGVETEDGAGGGGDAEGDEDRVEGTHDRGAAPVRELTA